MESIGGIVVETETFVRLIKGFLISENGNLEITACTNGGDRDILKLALGDICRVLIHSILPISGNL